MSGQVKRTHAESRCLECAALDVPRELPLLVRLALYGTLVARFVELESREKEECEVCTRFAVLVASDAVTPEDR